VLSYLPGVVGASRAAESLVTGTPAGTVVVRAAGLRVHGRTVTAGDAAPSAGELAVFCRPVVTAPAVVRRDGRILAGGWLPDFVRLDELERHLGDGVIGEIVAAALDKGRLKKRERRRIMSYPLVIRLMLAMVLMPDASYCEALARLAGLLADISFTLEWHVPTEKVITDWRLLVPARHTTRPSPASTDSTTESLRLNSYLRTESGYRHKERAASGPAPLGRFRLRKP
jgi:hypothetical protein